MKESIILKIVTEICLLFTFVSLFAVVNDNLILILCFVLTILACGIVAVKFNKIIFRILIMLVPLIYYIFFKDFVVIIFVSISYLYCFLVVALDRLYVEYISYKSLFIFYIVIIMAFLLILIAGSYIDTYINEGIIVFASLFFVFGISSLRLIRMQEYSDIKWRITNVGIIFAVSAITISIFYVIHLGILNSKVIFDTILLPVSYGITWFFSLFGKFFNLFKSSSDSSNTSESTSESIDNPVINPGSEKEIRHHESFWTKRLDIPWGNIFMVIGIIILIVLMILLIKRLSRKAKPALDYEVSNDTYKTIKKKKTKIVKDNAYQIRSIYKKYLYYLKSKGITIIEGNTSNEILVNSKKVTTSIYANRLREIYIKARYDIDAVNEDDIINAKKYYEAIIKNLEDDNSLLNK